MGNKPGQFAYTVTTFCAGVLCGYLLSRRVYPASTDEIAEARQTARDAQRNAAELRREQEQRRHGFSA